MAKDSKITKRMDRVQAIIEQFNPDEYGPKEGKELYDEGHRLLAEVRDILRDGNGDVIHWCSVKHWIAS